MNVPSDQVKSIFLQAIERHSPEGWPAFLEQACADDAELRAGVERLLRAHLDLGSFHEPAPSAAATIDKVSFERPGSTIGPYKLLQQIGEGGMGVVFMAEQTEPVRRKVALKVIKPGMDSKQVIARFEAERQALAMMDHVNIARVLDAGATHSGRPYFVMELVHGVPITKYCDDNHLMPRERLELFVPVCHAIQHAHQKGVIHRDIKPSNIMVTHYDGRPVAKVIDFGVAKATEQRLTERTLFTQYGTLVGTFQYMSPEQAEMSALGVDTRSDIYSLGVVLYELLTGNTPLSQEQVREAAYAEVLRMIKEEEPQKPSTRLSDSGNLLASISAQRKTEPAKLARMMRGELDWIVMKCLEKDRNRRYETANSVAADLLRYVSDEPVQACPPSAMYRFGKFGRRNKRILATAAVVVLALCLGTAISTWQAIRASRAEDLAEERLGIANANFKTAEEQRSAAQNNAEKARAQEKIAFEQERLAQRRFYASQINLAQHAWDEKRPARVLELLEGLRPKVGEEDLRSFEWYHLWRRCHNGCRLSLRSPGPACIAYSPDGKILAAGCQDASVRIWDATTGAEQAILRGHALHIWCLAFSPDGKTLASGADDGLVKLWDVASAKEHRSSVPIVSSVRSLAFSPNGEILAAGCEDGSVRLLGWANQQELGTVRGHSHCVLSLAFSADSKTLASASAWGEGNGCVHLWDLNASPIRSRLQLPGAATVAFTPNGETLAAAADTVRLYDTATGADGTVYKPFSFKISSIGFSPDGKTLAIGSTDRSVRLWQPATGYERVYAHLDQIMSVTFAPDGRTVASASADGAIKLWDPAAAPEPSTLTHAGRLGTALAPDGKTLALAGRTTLLCDANGLQAGAAIKEGNDGADAGVAAFSHDGKTLAIAAGVDVKLIDVATRQVRATLRGHTAKLWSLAFSPDDETLASAGYDGSAKVWDLAALQVRVALHGNAVAFSPDGKIIATGRDGTATLWDAATGQERMSFEAGRTAWVFSVCFSPDGKLVAQATDYGTVLLWDVAAGKLRASLRGHTAAISSVAFHPDGTTLASASSDKTVRLWDVPTGQERLSLTEHGEAVNCVAFAADGNTLATASDDGTVKLWRTAADPAATARKVEPPRGMEHRKAVAASRLTSALSLANSGRRGEAATAFGNAAAAYEMLIAQLEGEAAARRKETQSTAAISSEVGWYRHELGFAYVYQGGLLLQLGQLPEAEAILSLAFEVHSKLVRDYPATSAYRIRLAWSCRKLAEVHIASGHLDAAEVILVKAIEASPDEVITRCFRALSRAWAGDLSGYRSDCAEMFDLFGRVNQSDVMLTQRGETLIYFGLHFSHANQPDVMHRLAWTAALAPQAIDDPNRAVKLAEAALRNDPDNGKFSNILAAALYRAGRFQQAVAKLKELNAVWEQAVTKPTSYSPAYVWFFLAMGHQRMGDADEARRWLDKAIACAEQETKGDNLDWNSWNRRLTLELLRREAESIVKKASEAEPATAEKEDAEKN